jgi:hypothetical protein
MDKRHFTVVEKSGKEHGLYISSTPSSAAKKAVSKLCTSNKSKKVEFYLREITQGSKKKTYGPYVGHIEKLKQTIELKGRIIKYKPVVKLSEKSGSKKGGMIGGAPKASKAPKAPKAPNPNSSIYSINSNNNNNNINIGNQAAGPAPGSGLYNYVPSNNSSRHSAAYIPEPSAPRFENINRNNNNFRNHQEGLVATAPAFDDFNNFNNPEAVPAVNHRILRDNNAASLANNNNIGNSAAGPAVNHRILRDYNAASLANNNNISGNPAAGTAVAAHNDANNKQFKELCKGAIKAINRGISTIPGANLHTFPDLECLIIGFNHNELRKYNAIFIEREKSWQTQENSERLPSTNMRMIDEEGKKAAVQRFISELNSDMSIDQNVKEAWYCVIYNAFQNLQIAFPRKVVIKYPSISVSLGKGIVQHGVKNKTRPYEKIKIHGFVNDFPRPARYDESGLKPVKLMRKKTEFNYWNHPPSEISYPFPYPPDKITPAEIDSILQNPYIISTRNRLKALDLDEREYKKRVRKGLKSKGFEGREFDIAYKYLVEEY